MARPGPPSASGQSYGATANLCRAIAERHSREDVCRHAPGGGRRTPVHARTALHTFLVLATTPTPGPTPAPHNRPRPAQLARRHRFRRRPGPGLQLQARILCLDLPRRPVAAHARRPRRRSGRLWSRGLRRWRRRQWLRAVGVTRSRLVRRRLASCAPRAAGKRSKRGARRQRVRRLARLAVPKVAVLLAGVVLDPDALLPRCAGRAASALLGRCRRCRELLLRQRHVRLALGRRVGRLARGGVPIVAVLLSGGRHTPHDLLPHRPIVGVAEGAPAKAARRDHRFVLVVRGAVVVVLPSGAHAVDLFGLCKVAHVRQLHRVVKAVHHVHLVLLGAALAAVDLGRDAHAHQLVNCVVDLKVDLHGNAICRKLVGDEALHRAV
mmetsp:Transcript_16635/g.49758  ORF Transcript_16635/g.49758 Transcript_16635/m.49758 type:complete len:381 (-) Transcript_16635:3200-4342(-)